MALFLPSARQINWLLIVGFAALGEALYLRYVAIENVQVALACQAGLNTALGTADGVGRHAHGRTSKRKGVVAPVRGAKGKPRCRGSKTRSSAACTASTPSAASSSPRARTRRSCGRSSLRPRTCANVGARF